MRLSNVDIVSRCTPQLALPVPSSGFDAESWGRASGRLDVSFISPTDALAPRPSPVRDATKANSTGPCLQDVGRSLSTLPTGKTALGRSCGSASRIAEWARRVGEVRHSFKNSVTSLFKFTLAPLLRCTTHPDWGVIKCPYLIPWIEAQA